MSKVKVCFYGVMIGLINALFGAGGGLIAVSLLNKTYKDQKKAQATTVAVILPLTIVTAIRYLTAGYMTLYDAIPFIIPGFFGAILGSKILKKANNRFLKVIFTFIMLWAGVRLITK